MNLPITKINCRISLFKQTPITVLGILVIGLDVLPEERADRKLVNALGIPGMVDGEFILPDFIVPKGPSESFNVTALSGQSEILVEKDNSIELAFRGVCNIKEVVKVVETLLLWLSPWFNYYDAEEPVQPLMELQQTVGNYTLQHRYDYNKATQQICLTHQYVGGDVVVERILEPIEDRYLSRVLELQTNYVNALARLQITSEVKIFEAEPQYQTFTRQVAVVKTLLLFLRESHKNPILMEHFRIPTLKVIQQLIQDWNLLREVQVYKNGKTPYINSSDYSELLEWMDRLLGEAVLSDSAKVEISNLRAPAILKHFIYQL